MTIEGLGWTNFFLGILAVLSLIQFLIIAGVGFFAYRAYRKAAAAIETVEQRHIAPLRQKAEQVIDEAKGVVDRAQDLVERVRHAEESVAEAVKHAADASGQFVGSMRAKSWPLVGVVRGVKVAIDAMFNGRSHSPSPHPEGPPFRAETEYQ
jgi:hypothetical protein